MQNILERFQLVGKTALITGSSRGIGRELAIALGQAGAKIVINGLSEEKLAKTNAEFSEYGIESYGFVFDVNDENAVVNGIKAIKQQVGDIDILVNNAGIIKRAPILEMTTIVLPIHRTIPSGC